ncbi:MAG: alpha/beta family hydrolase, partial [Pseudomonadota bacterium]
VTKKLKLKDYFLGGKSMGGRIASHISNQTDANGLVAYGFPFYAPGKALADRHKPMLDSKIPTLVLQGERDAMGDKNSLKSIRWPKTHTLHFLPDGDHSLKPRKSSGHSLEEHLKTAAKLTLQFMEGASS